MDVKFKTKEFSFYGIRLDSKKNPTLLVKIKWGVELQKIRAIYAGTVSATGLIAE